MRWKVGLARRDPVIHPDDQPALMEVLNPAEIAEPPALGWRVVWLGHASFLLQGHGQSILIDPLFSDYCSPVPLPGLRRLRPPPIALAALPSINAILITHGHYDHLDLPTLKTLGKDTPVFLAEGQEVLLQRLGFSAAVGVPWWGSVTLSPEIKITAVPAFHFTARTPWDKNRAHWCGWVLSGSMQRFYHAGDTAWCAAFAEIGRRFGPIDLAMIPIGAYSPRAIMRQVHVSPEEAVDIHQAVGARQSLACHWGTFRLTDEPLGEPPLRLQAEMKHRQLPAESFRHVAIGQILSLNRQSIV